MDTSFFSGTCANLRGKLVNQTGIERGTLLSEKETTSFAGHTGLG